MSADQEKLDDEGSDDVPQPKNDKPALATPRSLKGAATRARLLNSARVVFEESGFLEARISDIAARAGLSQGSFYHYFDSKEQIFREVAEAQESMLTEHATSDPDDQSKDLSQFERIYRANRRYLEHYLENRQIMRVIEEVSRYDQPVKTARMARQKHFADRAERAIRQLQDDGSADPDIDAELAALALGSMVARFAEIWLIDGWGGYDLDHAAMQVTKLWVNAIGLSAPGTAGVSIVSS
jgi:AcrR family transcriptional regulator